MIPSAFYSFHLISFNYPNFKRPIPSQKWILKRQVRTPLSIPKHSTKIANVQTPSITSSEPLQKRPENLSEATAVFVGRVHRGPRRDQQLDHGGVAVLSRVMQRRVASGAEDATRTAGQLRLPSRNKRIVMGCFSGLLGKILNIGHKYFWISRR